MIKKKRLEMEEIEQIISCMLQQGTLELEIRNAGVFRYVKSYRFDRHSHREIEIVYIKSGHCIMGVGEQFVPLRERDCIILLRGVPHWFLVDGGEGCQIAQVEFAVKLPDLLREQLPVFRPVRYQKLSDCGQSVQACIESIGRLYRIMGKNAYQPLQMKLMFLLLFLELSAKVEEKDRIQRGGKTEEIIQYINENYQYEINIEKLAQQFRVSSRYIRKCFQEEAGISCSQYIMVLRIQKAKEMLWGTKETVTEIAARTGFNSSQYFCRVFQKAVNMTPVEYRNIWKGQKAEERCVEEE